MDTIDRRMILAGAGLVGAAALARVAKGGPLDPPLGPVAPTGRTVQEIYDKVARTSVGYAEPRVPVQSLPGSATALHVITEPGSYYLTGNILGQPGKNGIEIHANGVVLDLQGYAVIGCGLAGITSIGTAAHIKVFNGRSRQNGAFGVDLTGADGTGFGGIVEDVRAEDNTRDGIRVRYGAIARCFASGNGDNGISGVIATVTECWAGLNPGVGIGVCFGSLVQHCNAHGNGAVGIVACGGSRIVHSIASGSGGDGLQVTDQSSAAHNIANGNQTGIAAFNDNCEVSDNVLIRNPADGIRITGSGTAVFRNRVRGSASPFSIAAGNSHGPIVNVAGVGDISAVPNANHPQANFVY
ncbi:MAG: hypothetical protein GIKADHBN_00243 [Phycisphaerales bacterium]|nr:hypothetical protein [Phycisphaerales bacterium]